MKRSILALAVFAACEGGPTQAPPPPPPPPPVMPTVTPPPFDIVLRLNGNFTHTMQQRMNAAVERWEAVLKPTRFPRPERDWQEILRSCVKRIPTGFLPPDVNLIVLVDAEDIGAGSARGGWCGMPLRNRSFHGIQAGGYITWDTRTLAQYDTLPPASDRWNQFEATMLHELGHVLGLFGNPAVKYLRTRRDDSTWLFTGENAVREYHAAGGREVAPPFDGHWTFHGETMSSAGGLQLSRITLGALEDIGYTVDYGQADEYTVRDR